ncbi:hypothetical protein [Metabacillus idriensis]|uniref:hypothetical protein n=1 Tax=Metabacillus idriensis TaxID=324768 RepID=UPI001749CC61|nr:hypothetical protein [Metabacillus idriensis]
MKIGDQITNAQKDKLNQNKPKKKRKKEEYVNWHEMMGTNRDTYERRGGALRNKRK